MDFFFHVNLELKSLRLEFLHRSQMFRFLFFFFFNVFHHMQSPSQDLLLWCSKSLAFSISRSSSSPGRLLLLLLIQILSFLLLLVLFSFSFFKSASMVLESLQLKFHVVEFFHASSGTRV